MGTTERNKPLIGGLTFLGSTAFQIALGLVLKSVSSDTGRDGVSGWIDAHPWASLVVLLLVSTLLTSGMLWFVSRQDSDAVPREELLDAATRQLAAGLREQLENDAQSRGLDAPRAIPVRWRTADESLMDQWSSIQLDPESVLPLHLDGGGNDIVDVFRRIPSCRLVVLGKAGAGKSVLMLRFMRSVLAENGADSSARVPVLFALATWDPTTSPLRDWLARELADQQPSLGQRMPDGRSMARALIDGERLVYVLDGLDEMPSTLRAEAMRAMSASLRHADRALVTSRLAEYRAAVAAAGPLAAAAAVVLEDLRPSDVQSYLPSTTGDARRGSRWTPVLADIDSAPTGTPQAVLREALQTPLMVNLARIVYQNPGTQPQDLLAAGGTEQIEGILLDRYVEAALDPGPGLRARRRGSLLRAEHYLAEIARYMFEAKTPYFRWWELANSLTVRARIYAGFIAGLAVTIVAVATIVLVFTLSGEPLLSTADFISNYQTIAPIIAPGLIVGLLVGRHAHTGGVVKANTPLIPVRLRRSWGRTARSRPRARTSMQTLGLALRLGIAVAGTTGVVIISAMLADWLPDSRGREGTGSIVIILLFALLFTLGSFLIFTASVWAALQVGQWLEEPVKLSEVWTPIALIRSNRLTVILESLLGGVAAAIFSALAAIPALLLVRLGDLAEGDPVGLRPDDLLLVLPLLGYLALCAAVLTILIMIFTLTAWGRFALARLYYASIRRFPLRLMRFLAAAHKTGILRQTGPAFQFRHLKLRDRLAQRSF